MFDLIWFIKIHKNLVINPLIPWIQVCLNIKVSKKKKCIQTQTDSAAGVAKTLQTDLKVKESYDKPSGCKKQPSADLVSNVFLGILGNNSPKQAAVVTNITRMFGLFISQSIKQWSFWGSNSAKNPPLGA